MVQQEVAATLWPPPAAEDSTPDLQDFGQLFAVLQLQGGVEDALVAGCDLLRLFLQGGLEVQAAQSCFVLWDQKHLEDQGEANWLRQGDPRAKPRDRLTGIRNHSITKLRTVPPAQPVSPEDNQW